MRQKIQMVSKFLTKGFFGVLLVAGLLFPETSFSQEKNNIKQRNIQQFGLVDFFKTNNHSEIKRKSPLALLGLTKGGDRRTKSIGSIPYNIEKIEEYEGSFDTAYTFQEWELIDRYTFSQLESGNGYSILDEYYVLGEVDEQYKLEVLFNESEQVEFLYDYNYDDFDDEWTSEFRIAVSYDNEGRIIQYTEDDLEMDEWISNWKIEFVYNEDGTISYESESRNYNYGAQGVLKSIDGNIVDEGIYNDDGSDEYFRDTYYNITLDQFLDMEEYWIDFFSWHNMEVKYEYKDSEGGEYYIDEYRILIDESESQKVFTWAWQPYDYETGTYADTLAYDTYREVVNYADGKISDILYEFEFDGEWKKEYKAEYTYGSGNTVSNENWDNTIEGFSLHQNYPNPFNPSTQISFALPAASEVKLRVFDMLGRNVATLVNSRKAAGIHTVNFDAGNLSSGTYIYRLEAGNFTKTRKLMLIK